MCKLRFEHVDHKKCTSYIRLHANTPWNYTVRQGDKGNILKPFYCHTHKSGLIVDK